MGIWCHGATVNKHKIQPCPDTVRFKSKTFLVAWISVWIRLLLSLLLLLLLLSLLLLWYEDNTKQLYVFDFMMRFGMNRTVRYREILWWHDDVIKCKHFPRYWPFVRAIHRSPVNSPTKASDVERDVFSVSWVTKGEAGDLRRHRTHYYVTVTKRIKSSVQGLFLV